MGTGAAWLAHRVLDDGARDAWRPDRHPLRRTGLALPAPRERDRAERIVHRARTVREVLAAPGPGDDRDAEDGPLAGELHHAARHAGEVRAGRHSALSPAGALSLAPAVLGG